MSGTSLPRNQAISVAKNQVDFSACGTKVCGQEFQARPFQMLFAAFSPVSPRTRCSGCVVFPNQLRADFSRFIFGPSREVRDRLAANGSERAAMDWANSIFCDRGQVPGGAVAFVLGESVIRIPAMVLEHETIARYLGQNTGSRNRKAFARRLSRERFGEGEVNSPANRRSARDRAAGLIPAAPASSRDMRLQEC